MPLISIVTPCYNEEDNVKELSLQIREIFHNLPAYDYEHIYIDNCSIDKTVEFIKEIAKDDKHVKLIVNARNFGHIRSPNHGMLQAKGDAVILMASDFQDPPLLITDFIRKWEEGYKIILGVKTKTQESLLMKIIRNSFYGLISRLSEIEITKNNTGFGLYDRQVIEIVRKIDDPYPYFRGLISDIGFESAKVEFYKPARKRGISSNNFYTLYDLAMLGITNHSKVPLRLATMSGFLLAFLSLLVAFGYLVAKLVFWNTFSMGLAPIIIGLFFFSSVQLLFIGIIGEYLGAIHTQVLKRPLVIEKERVNF